MPPGTSYNRLQCQLLLVSLREAQDTVMIDRDKDHLELGNIQSILAGFRLLTNKKKIYPVSQRFTLGISLSEFTNNLIQILSILMHFIN